MKRNQPDRPHMRQEKLVLYAKLDDGSGRCPSCDNAKAWLNERQIPYELEELDIVGRQILYDNMGLKAPYRTVPQAILYDCEGGYLPLGGSEDLEHSGLSQSLFKS